MAEKFYMTWEAYGNCLVELKNRLKRVSNLDDFNYVVGIPRGGLPIAVYLSHWLNLDLMDIGDFLGDGIRRDNVILVDDLVDEAKTLIALFPNGIKDVFVATLFRKPWTPVDYIPNLSLSETDKWIVFPYEDPMEEPNRGNDEGSL